VTRLTTTTLLQPFVCDSRVSQYQKKHSPIHTYPDHQPSFISFLYLLRSIACSLFNLGAWQSFCETSLQVLFGIPLQINGTDYKIQKRTMADRWYLFTVTESKKLQSFSFLLKSVFFFLSPPFLFCRFMLHIHSGPEVLNLTTALNQLGGTDTVLNIDWLKLRGVFTINKVTLHLCKYSLSYKLILLIKPAIFFKLSDQ